MIEWRGARRPIWAAELFSEDRMTKEKQAPKKQPEPAFDPIDDLYGDASKPVDTDLDLDKGKFSEPPRKP